MPLAIPTHFSFKILNEKEVFIANDWQMSFNTDKCSVIHLGNDNPKHKYSLCGSDLRESIKERDLGIIVDSSMKFTEQCNIAIKNANSTLGLIRRTIKCKSKNIITKLYKTLVRHKLEYCVQAWRPYLNSAWGNVIPWALCDRL